MLATRIKTAVALFALVALILFVLPPLSWVLFCCVVAAVGFWEWLGLTAKPYLTGASRVVVSAVVGLLLAAVMLFAPVSWMAWLTGVSLLSGSAFWLLVVPFWLVRQWRLNNAWLHFVVGLVLIIPAWSALVSLKPVPPEPWLLLAVMAVP